MSRVPDHTPAAAAVEHAAVIAALDAGDLAAVEAEHAATLVDTCPGCAALLADLGVLRAATAALPAAPRTRDYRLTDADAARLRPSAWRLFVGWLGAPQSTVRPLAGGLAALGIAGLLLSTTPGLFGQSAAAPSTMSAPLTAPGAAGATGGGAEGNPEPSAAASTAAGTGADAAATVEPGATSAPGTSGSTPRPAGVAVPAPSPAMVELPAPSPAMVALPAPSPAGVALPGPTGLATTRAVTGPAAAATPGPSGFAADAGAADAGAPDAASKAVPPEASQAQRNAALTPVSEPGGSDRSLPLALSLVLLASAIGLLAVNRLLRRRAHA